MSQRKVGDEVCVDFMGEIVAVYATKDGIKYDVVTSNGKVAKISSEFIVRACTPQDASVHASE